MRKFLNQKINSSGFTLVETLVSLSIFSIAVIVMMSFLSQGLSDTGYAKKKATAAYLAQEGVEYIRNLRDTYMLYSSSSQAGWGAFLGKLNPNSCGSANGCYFDDRDIFLGNSMPITNLFFYPCSSSSCPSGELLYNANTGKYSYVGGSPSGYVRKIKYSTVSANEIKVTSTVSWTQKSSSYSISFSENIFLWLD